MATTKKAKGKSKAKRKKTTVTKAATRRKTATVRKTRTVRKQPAKKAPARRASPKKAKPTAKAAIKPTPASPPGERVAVTRYYIYVTRGGDTQEFFWEADNEEEARLLVDIWNETPAQHDELYFIEPYEGDE